MNWTILGIVYFCLMNVLTVESQNSIGLRASSYLRGILFGTAVGIDKLRNRVDHDQYNSNVTNNYHLIVPESELKPMHLWWSDNVYNWTDLD